MKLVLVDPKQGVCTAWQQYFGDFPDVEIVHGYFEELSEYDCMVSAANSFGLMDGGVDAAIIRFFGMELMHRVQKRILEDYLGEQPVGTAFVVETNHPKHPFLVHTPTMRVPMTITHTDNVYRAMWAMLLAVHHHNRTQPQKIDIIACPGLGTATGEVPYRRAAHQMALAYKHYLNPPRYLNWETANNRQSEIHFGGDDGFSLPPSVD